MILGKVLGKQTVAHDVREDFVELLSLALRGEPIMACMGPVYEEDPAAVVLEPFRRSQRESNWGPMDEVGLAPQWALERARELRWDAAKGCLGHDARTLKTLDRWARAGLVLELGSRYGIHLRDGRVVSPLWKLRGTVTGRFGVEPGSFNPLVIPHDRRKNIVSSSPDGKVVAFDFRAMDLCSMRSLFPAIDSLYIGCDDPHARTAEILGVDRELAKVELFVHCYGGHSSIKELFDRRMPELEVVRGLGSGEGARKVQSRSAEAFRAALSAALPTLVGERVRPMFSVHDELVVDLDQTGVGLSIGLSDLKRLLHDVKDALGAGASDELGVPCEVGLGIGSDYAMAKSGHGVNV